MVSQALFQVAQPQLCQHPVHIRQARHAALVEPMADAALGHAQASHIQVQLQLNDNTMVLRVSDNGRGRAPDTWSHGLGLGGIRKRVKQLGGSVRWLEIEPKGIRCEVVIENFSNSSHLAGGAAG